MTRALVLRVLEALDGAADEDPLDALAAIRHAVERGNDDAALGGLLRAVRAFHAREEDYVRLVAELVAWLERAGAPREALAMSWYSLGRGRQERWLDAATPSDRARTWLAWSERGEMPRGDACRLAAAALEGAGLDSRAALALEAGALREEALACWTRLADRLEPDDREPYSAGLARFNVARLSVALGDDVAARRASGAAVQHLEEAADRFESDGRRERAYDAYLTLVEVGRLLHLPEDVVEGAVNAARILVEDQLFSHAMGTLEEAIEVLESLGEPGAAATLARDLAVLAERHGHPVAALPAGGRTGRLWLALAERPGTSRTAARHALRAAAAAHAEAGLLASTARAFERLAGESPDARSREHFRAAAARLTGAADPPAPPSDAAPRRRAPRGPEVWRDDLVEWEARGLASEACAEVLFDRRCEPVTRRAALVGRLVAQLVEAATGWPDRAPGAPEVDRRRALTALARHLAPLETYVALAPLELLAADADAPVRQAAVEVVGGYYYKRSFGSLEQALRDPAPGVAEAARRAVERLCFDHALEPLARIARSADADARAAALRGIARIDGDEAARLLLATLEHGAPVDADVVLAAVSGAPTAAFTTAARAALSRARGRLRESLSAFLGARGLRG